jgi:hemoglobin
MSTPTLYEWAGGQAAFEKLTEVFYAKVQKDDMLAEVFRDMSSEHAKHVAHFIAEVFGGPKVYTEHDKGSHAYMVSRHVGRKLDDTKRKRWVQLIMESADEVGMPDDPEFRSALVSYLEWGSRIAVINSQSSENPIGKHTAMPKWGWGETGGPYQPKPKKAD